MPQLSFYKYQGTGNDFILLDNRKGAIKLTTKQIRDLCNRKFGIGADGLMLLQTKKGYAFEMVYFNSDGKPSSMCGNGGRCIAKFAKDLGIINEQAIFLAVDGPHEVIFEKNLVRLKMIDVNQLEVGGDYYFLNTGSPHYIIPSSEIEKINLIEDARKIRYSKRFSAIGTNVNFIEKTGNASIKVRTYERGVEDETLSCGTGVTAAALCVGFENPKLKSVSVKTPGGKLKVYFTLKNNIWSNIWLEGPAERTFKGEVNV